MKIALPTIQIHQKKLLLCGEYRTRRLVLEAWERLTTPNTEAES